MSEPTNAPASPPPNANPVNPLPSALALIAARIGAEVAGPNACDVDRQARFPREAIDALRAERMLSVLVPIEFGGAGAEFPDVAAAVEVLGRYCASTAMIYAMHQI